MTQLGMGSLLGVSQGSAAPPALIIVRYKPETPSKSTDHLALIGNARSAVTFDTKEEGVSIKPADSMEKMAPRRGGGAS